jgi:hypothetical protein
MGMVVAAVLPLATLLGVLIAATRPLGSDSVMLVVGVLAAAGVVLVCCAWVHARTRRR